MEMQDAARELAECLGMAVPSENGSGSEDSAPTMLTVGPFPPLEEREDGDDQDDGETVSQPDDDGDDRDTYTYRDPSAERVAQKIRKPEKSFRWRRWTGSGWSRGLGGLDVPLFHLPLVNDAVQTGDPIWIVEGEKDVLTGMRVTGETLTTPPDGAGSWKPHHTESLAGADAVHIVSDNDPQGWSHAAEIAREIEEEVGEVRAFLPAVENDHADLTDHLRAGHTLDDLQPVDVEELERKAARAKILRDASDQRLNDLKLRIFSAREILEGDIPPEPQCEVPRLAWERRLTLFTAPKGGGKTTLFSAAAARFTRGDSFLGDSTGGPGSVLYLTEETVEDPAVRHQEWGGDPDLFHMVEGVGRDPLEDLELAAALLDPNWIIVDTLSAFAEPMQLDVNDDAGWTKVLRQIRSVAQLHDATATVAHHPKKGTSIPRNSGAIEEQVDVSLVYKRAAGSQTAALSPRKARRLDMDALESEIRLRDDGFELVGEHESGPSLQSRVRAFIAENEPVTKTEIREGVRGDNGEIDAALRALIDNGEVYDDDSEPGRGCSFKIDYSTMTEG